MSDPICRVQNPYPKNVVKLVNNMPHTKMSFGNFREFMKKSEYGVDSFFRTYYQLACQLGLYYIDEENIYHPRFTKDITEEQAKDYLIFWFSKYYVPNPYTRGFDKLEKPILVEASLYEYIKNNGASEDILDVCKAIFKEEIGNPDIFINAINNFSQKIAILNQKIELKPYREVSMEINNSRNDKKAFFHEFDETASTVLPFPHNRIIFGAPGTGKSFKLKNESGLFEKQIKKTSDRFEAIKQAIFEADNSSDKLNKFIAIGFKYSSDLKGYSKKKISEVFNLGITADNIYIGAQSESYYSKIENDSDLLEEINKAKLIKGDGMLQYLAGIGFKFSAELFDYTKDELRKELNLDSNPQTYWVYRAVHGSKYLGEKKREEKFLERVTFHPNYSYAQFVGTYKPVQDFADENQIKYEYVPGAFMRVYRAAKLNPSQNYLLLIEEINRANVAAVFGDVFQLLDRDENGVSEYPVAASEDIKKYLAKNGIYEDELRIPSNMYIWATMNSADQGVFPMDTAFKRRWEFEYIDINKNADKLVYEDGKKILVPIPIGNKIESNESENLKYILVEWDKLRREINNKLSAIQSVNEDKWLGPFFIGLEKLRSAKVEPQNFIKLFKSKVLMYLYEDVVKINPTKLFVGCGDHPKYSTICEKFNEIGCGIFDLELEKQNPSETESSETANE